jgi:hypothetical protein
MTLKTTLRNSASISVKRPRGCLICILKWWMLLHLRRYLFQKNIFSRFYHFEIIMKISTLELENGIDRILKEFGVKIGYRCFNGIEEKCCVDYWFVDPQLCSPLESDASGVALAKTEENSMGVKFLYCRSHARKRRSKNIFICDGIFSLEEILSQLENFLRLTTIPSTRFDGSVFASLRPTQLETTD